MNEKNNTNSEKIRGVIYEAIDALNDSLPKERRIEKSPQSSLFDETGAVDSLGLTLLIVSLEQKLEEQLGLRVTLVSDMAPSSEGGPFQNVYTLTNHILELAAEQNG